MRFLINSLPSFTEAWNTAQCGVNNPDCQAIPVTTGNANAPFLILPSAYSGASTAPYDLSLTKTADKNSAVE
jgi:hypothetical protein